LKIAHFDQSDVIRLLADAGIIRSRAKINGAITNARAWITVMEVGGNGAFANLLWQHVDHRTSLNSFCTSAQVPASTVVSESMSRTLKKSGFSFCGPTICYAFMQAVGMTNDHLVACPRHSAVAQLARTR